MCHGQFVNGCVPNLANLSESRTLFNFVLADSMFSVIDIFSLSWPTLIFGRAIFHKTSIQNVDISIYCSWLSDLLESHLYMWWIQKVNNVLNGLGK